MGALRRFLVVTLLACVPGAGCFTYTLQRLDDPIRDDRIVGVWREVAGEAGKYRREAVFRPDGAGYLRWNGVDSMKTEAGDHVTLHRVGASMFLHSDFSPGCEKATETEVKQCFTLSRLELGDGRLTLYRIDIDALAQASLRDELTTPHELRNTVGSNGQGGVTKKLTSIVLTGSSSELRAFLGRARPDMLRYDSLGEFNRVAP